IVSAGVANAALVSSAKRLHAFRGAGGDDVLGGAGLADGVGARAAVAGGEDDHVLLISGGGERRAGRLRVAHDGVVRLAERAIRVRRVAPAIAADARAVVVGLRFEVGD